MQEGRGPCSCYRGLSQGSKPTGDKDPIKPVASSSMYMMFISTLAMGNKGKGRVKSLQAHTLNPTPIWQGRSEGGRVSSVFKECGFGERTEGEITC